MKRVYEEYGAFPHKYDGEWYAGQGSNVHPADTPQKAIALAVIGSVK